MPNRNKVFIQGHLCKDVELRYTPSGVAVADIAVATNRKWKGKDGSDKEEVAFIDCTVWGGFAEGIAHTAKKGSAVDVEGRLTQQTWEGKDGQKRSKLIVTAETCHVIGGGERHDATRPQGRPAPAETQEDSGSVPF